jgi:hypothetical protein
MIDDNMAEVAKALDMLVGWLLLHKFSQSVVIRDMCGEMKKVPTNTLFVTSIVTNYNWCRQYNSSKCC